MDLNEDPSNFEQLSQEEQDSLSVEDETDGFDQNNHSSDVIEQDEPSSTDIEVDAIQQNPKMILNHLMSLRNLEKLLKS